MRGRSSQLQRPRRGQHFLDVDLHLHLAPTAAQDALLVDQEAGALDAHVLAPVERLLDPGAVGLADLAVLVRGEGSEEHTSELLSLMRISSAVFCLTNKITEKQRQLPY